ncbi:MAG: pyridoxamine 5-phosphate oxidase-related FMN-binding, partial [Propionibacteriaceae bacterium]|nr:pyridoxamine 5-phosphate oxidase-related FMN-binding [Propionibacteriaceae bacterium]
PETIHQRNLRTHPEVVVHLPDPMAAVIVEGRAAWRRPQLADAKRLVADSKGKYGYAPPPATYIAGTWALAPRRVLAWTSIADDPTRFEFVGTRTS